jgi:hypothetical protein
MERFRSEIMGVAHHLTVAGIADKDQMTAVTQRASNLVVDLGDKCAGGIENVEPELASAVVCRRRDPVGRKDHRRFLREIQ